METAYLKKCFGNSLTQALAEVAKVRPSDPIEYLAHWLYHYRNVMKAREKNRQEEDQLEEDSASSLKDAEMMEMLKQKERQIQQKCKKCHREMLPTAASSKTSGLVKKDPEPAVSPGSLPGTSLQQLDASEPAGQTGGSFKTRREISAQEVSAREVAQAVPPGSTSPSMTEIRGVLPASPSSVEEELPP